MTEEIFRKCEVCDTKNIQNGKFCHKCGHKFGIEDLEREFRVGKLYALENIKKNIISWLSGFGVLIAILSFFGISGVRDAYKSELQEIIKEKEKLDNTYKSMQELSKSLNNMVGNTNSNQDISSMIKSLYLNLYTIKDIYIQAEYTYESSVNLDQRLYVPFWEQVNIFKEESDKPFLEFHTKKDSITRVDNDKVLLKYILFQPFENKLFSTSLTNLNSMKYINFVNPNKLFKNEEILNKILKDIEDTKLKSLTLSVYVNSVVFWEMKIPIIKAINSITIHKPEMSLIRFTKKQNFEKEFIDVQEVLANKYDKVKINFH